MPDSDHVTCIWKNFPLPPGAKGKSLLLASLQPQSSILKQILRSSPVQDASMIKNRGLFTILSWCTVWEEILLFACWARSPIGDKYVAGGRRLRKPSSLASAACESSRPLTARLPLHVWSTERSSMVEALDHRIYSENYLLVVSKGVQKQTSFS